MQKIIVTGATGFIGSELTRKMLLQGSLVYGIGRNREKLHEFSKFRNFNPVVAEFDQYPDLTEIIKERDFDILYHFAWKGTSTATYNDYSVQTQNIKSVCDIAEAAVRLRCKKICIAGSYYQGYTAKDDIADNTFNPVIYGIIKKCSANIFKAIAYKNGIACTNVIIPNAFGIGDKPNTATMFFIKSMLANNPINLIEGNKNDDWVYIDDLIDGIVIATKSGKNFKDYYIGHCDITTFKEKLIEMKSLLSSKSELLFGTYPETYPIDYEMLNIRDLALDTGFQPKTTFSDAILRTAEWIKTSQ